MSGQMRRRNAVAGLVTAVAGFGALAVVNMWWFLFAVGVLVAMVVHELGHFVAARRAGMKVTEFFVGFGPKVWSTRRGDTEYGLRVLPLGAYVQIVGMSKNDDVDPADEHRTYRAQPFRWRLLVVSAGSITHVTAALAMLTVLYATVGEVRTDRGVVLSDMVAITLGAADAGIGHDDRLVAFNGEPIVDADHFDEMVAASIPGEVAQITLVRSGVEQTVDVAVSAGSKGQGFIAVAALDPSPYTVEHSPVGAFARATRNGFGLVVPSLESMSKVANPVTLFEHLTGQRHDMETRPMTLVGTAGLTDDVADAPIPRPQGADGSIDDTEPARMGLFGILYVLAGLNMFVGVFNMLPLPPLDGGHAAIAVYERIRQRRSGERFHADVAKLRPLTVGVLSVLGIMFASGLWLDITSPFAL